MKRQTGEDVFDGNQMKKGMIIRHLILPQNTNSSIEIIDYIAENFPDTYLSITSPDALPYRGGEPELPWPHHFQVYIHNREQYTHLLMI
mgnify:CR=1 FL=1